MLPADGAEYYEVKRSRKRSEDACMYAARRSKCHQHITSTFASLLMNNSEKWPPRAWCMGAGEMPIFWEDKTYSDYNSNSM